jgi:hypothetical protein
VTSGVWPDAAPHDPPRGGDNERDTPDRAARAGGPRRAHHLGISDAYIARADLIDDNVGMRNDIPRVTGNDSSKGITNTFFNTLTGTSVPRRISSLPDTTTFFMTCSISTD